MRRYLRDPTFSLFDRIPECDGHTHTHTDGQTDTQTDTRRRHIPRLARRRAVINAQFWRTIYLARIICTSELHTPVDRMLVHIGSFGNRIISEIY